MKKLSAATVRKTKARFLEVLTEAGSIEGTLVLMGGLIAKSQIYRWRAEDEDFAGAIIEAQRSCDALIITTLYSRALNEKFAGKSCGPKYIELYMKHRRMLVERSETKVEGTFGLAELSNLAAKISSRQEASKSDKARREMMDDRTCLRPDQERRKARNDLAKRGTG